jgi:hypothetical protein
MPWIRFGRDEPPAPSLPLLNLQGQAVSTYDYRGKSPVVLAFLHAAGCPVCHGVAQSWAARRAEVEALDGKLHFVLPDAAGRDLDPALTLLDPQGQLRARYAKLLEFDTEGQVLIFVLDEHNAPYAGWVGAEPDDSAIWYDLLRWLLYVSIQCPE